MDESGVIVHPATYPPKVIDVTILGYVRETNGIGYSRDIGRPVQLGGNDYIIFGDTFCKNQDGEFVGIVDNTATLIESRDNPLESTYPSIRPDGKVEPLIHWNAEEQRLFDENGTRTCLWPFSGIVEASPGVGWMWFEKSQISKNGGEDVITPFGIGLAMVVCDEENRQLRAIREKDMLFDTSEPRIGSFSTIVEGDFIYLFGQHERPKVNDGEVSLVGLKLEETDLEAKKTNGSYEQMDEHAKEAKEPEKELQVFLARVDKTQPFNRTAYRYWNGVEYVEGLWDAIPIFRDLQQGAIIKSTIWGPSRPWVFVGNDKTGSSQLLVGVAANIEGPWETKEVCTTYGIDYNTAFRYCMYPHQWASKEEDGELLVTVCEQWPGGVVATKLKFETEKSIYWETVPINDYSNTIRQSLTLDSILLRVSAGVYNVRFSIEGRVVCDGMYFPEGEMPLQLRIKGDDLQSVKDAVEITRKILCNMISEERRASNDSELEGYEIIERQ